MQYVKTDQSGSYEHCAWVESIDKNGMITAVDPQTNMRIEPLKNVDDKDITVSFVDI